MYCLDLFLKVCIFKSLNTDKISLFKSILEYKKVLHYYYVVKKITLKQVHKLKVSTTLIMKDLGIYYVYQFKTIQLFTLTYYSEPVK